MKRDDGKKLVKKIVSMSPEEYLLHEIEQGINLDEMLTDIEEFLWAARLQLRGKPFLRMKAAERLYRQIEEAHRRATSLLRLFHYMQLARLKIALDGRIHGGRHKEAGSGQGEGRRSSTPDAENIREFTGSVVADLGLLGPGEGAATS